MPSSFVGPIGPLPVELQTTAKPPSYQLQMLVEVSLPPGPAGPSFLCSGLGLGFSVPSAAGASPTFTATRHTAANVRCAFKVSSELSADPNRAPNATQERGDVGGRDILNHAGGGSRGEVRFKP